MSLPRAHAAAETHFPHDDVDCPRNSTARPKRMLQDDAFVAALADPRDTGAGIELAMASSAASSRFGQSLACRYGDRFGERLNGGNPQSRCCCSRTFSWFRLFLVRRTGWLRCPATRGLDGLQLHKRRTDCELRRGARAIRLEPAFAILAHADLVDGLRQMWASSSSSSSTGCVRGRGCAIGDLTTMTS